MTAPREVQMARLETLAKLKMGIEGAVEKYRDFPRDELTTGQFAAQIMMAIAESGVAFYLDPVTDKPAPQ